MELASGLSIFFAASVSAALIYVLKLRDDSAEKEINHQSVIDAISYIISVDDRTSDLVFLKKILHQIDTTSQCKKVTLNYSFNDAIILDPACHVLESELSTSDLKTILNNKEPIIVPLSESVLETSFYLHIPIVHLGVVNLILSCHCHHKPNRGQINAVLAMSTALWQSMRKKHRNKRIYERELFLRTATEKGDIGLFDWQLHKNEVQFSDVWKSQLGYQPHELSNDFEEWQSRVHPDDLEEATRLLNACFNQPAEGYFFEHRLLHKQGHYVWVRAQAEIYTDEAGNPERMLGAHIDISDFKAIELQLRTERDTAHGMAQQHETILETVNEGIIGLDAEGKHTFFSAAASKILGFSSHVLLGKRYSDTWYTNATDERKPPFSFDSIPLAETLKTGAATVCNDWFVSEEGQLIPVQRKTSPVINEGQVTGVVISFSDISQQIENERSLKLSAAVFDNTAEGIMITNADNTIVSVNPAFERITGFSQEEAIGQNPNMLSSGKTRASVYHDMWQSIQETGSWKGEILNRKKSGKLFTELLSVSTLHDDFGASYHVAVLSDISNIKATQERLSQLANHDRLTGIPNKFFFENLVTHLINKDKRLKRKAALLYLDLDRFKNVNDSLGHDYGDDLIIECSRRIKAHVRDMDYIARIGGDEFAVFVESYTSEDEVYALAQRLISVVSEPYDLSGCTTHIGLSVGIAFYPKDGQNIETLKKASDTALYKAKSAGRGVFSAFSSDMSDLAKERQELETRLRLAMQNDVLELHYQPQVSLGSENVLGYEALARWTDPLHGSIPPDKFIPLAEETGLIVELGHWALDTAAAQMKDWLKQGNAPEYIAVNISAIQLARTDLVADVSSVLEKYDIPASCIELEITESFLIHDPDEAKRVLILLKDLGIRIAIDDFGTGFSSLGYIKSLPCDCLKIDKSFVQGITEDSSDQSLVKAIIAMSQGLGLEVVAEGV